MVVVLTLQQIEHFFNAHGAIAQVAAASEGGVVLLHQRNFTEAREQGIHLLRGDEALRVVRDENEGSRGGLYELLQAGCGMGFGVVGGAVPVGGYAGDFGDLPGPLIIHQQIEHEIIGTVGVLVVGRIQIGEIQRW